MMPSESGPQHRLMEARAHGAKFPMAKKIPMKVAKEFAVADKGKTFKGKRKTKHDSINAGYSQIKMGDVE